LPKVLHERGYLIPAVNSESTDYVACAEQLKETILQHHPTAHVTVLTRDQLPYGDLGGYANDWQVFYASPYRQTIKLEADMIAAGPVDHWWTLFEKRDVVISQGARNFYDQYTADRRYRRIFDANNLPNVYNAITYWRLSQAAQEFFDLVKNIFLNWDQFKTLLKFPEDIPSTDVVYAMAAVIMGTESVTLPLGLGPSIVHMKPGIVPVQTDWWQELVWEADPFRIQTVVQWGLVHYHNKSWRIA
jgi:hypothetical protein